MFGSQNVKLLAAWKGIFSTLGGVVLVLYKYSVPNPRSIVVTDSVAAVGGNDVFSSSGVWGLPLH